ncbi:MAG: hypothetical protein FWD87_02020 [Spirochaetaceae bacterium]|nr:hypothetical protein [Spirochaetaceae bacterium]
MAKKLKSFFKKKYKAKTFEKKLLKKVFIKKDRDLLVSVYEKQDNEYLLKPVDDEKKIVELNKLASHIKRNSGALGIGKIGAAIVLVSISVFFFAILLNPLAHRGMEAGLEGIFGGETEITGFRLDIFGGSIRFNTLQVADKDDLDRNLFQTGRTVIDFNMREILKGKFNANEISLEDFAIGERRATRARPLATTGREPARRQQQQQDGGLGLPTLPNLPTSLDDARDAVTSLLPDIPDRETVRKVINDNLNRLTTPVVIEENINAITSGTTRIRSNAEGARRDIETLTREVNEISRTRIASPADIAIAERVRTANNTWNSINSNISSTRDELSSLENTITQSARTIQDSLSADVNFITSLFPSIDSFRFSSLVEPLIMEQLQPFIEKYGTAFDIAMQIIESGRRVDTSREERTRPVTVKKRRGRDVQFHAVNTPSLHIEKISGSFFTGRERQALRIDDITNDQELLGRPLVFLIDSNIRGINTNIDGLFDTRRAARDFSNINVSVVGNSFSNAEFLSAVGIDRFGSALDFNVTSAISPERDYRGTTGITLRSLDMEPRNNVGNIIRNIIGESNITFDVIYQYVNHRLSLRLSSNIDNIIANAISPEQIAAEIRAFAQDALQDLIQERMAFISDARGEINNLRAQVGDFENQLRERRHELDEALRSSAPVPSLPVPSGATPSLPTHTPPSINIPGLPGRH